MLSNDKRNSRVSSFFGNDVEGFTITYAENYFVGHDAYYVEDDDAIHECFDVKGEKTT